MGDLRGIDLARRAKAEGHERRLSKAAEIAAAKRAEEDRLHQIASQRLDRDYEAWVQKIVRAAQGGASSARCAPFDDLGDQDYTKIVRHHGTWEVWDSNRDGHSRYSHLQYAYLAALADRLRKDGFDVTTHERVRDVPDYGTVDYCEIEVSGW